MDTFNTLAGNASPAVATTTAQNVTGDQKVMNYGGFGKKKTDVSGDMRNGKAA